MATQTTEYASEQWIHDKIYEANLNKKSSVTISLSAFEDLVLDREAWRTHAKSCLSLLKEEYEKLKNTTI